MGCKGSKHALHEQGRGGGGLPSESWRYSGLVGRHSVAPRLSTLGTLSLDRAAAAGVPFAAGGGDAEAIMTVGNDGDAAIGKLGPPRSFAGWHPRTPPVAMAPVRRHNRRVAPRTPNKTPARAPEEINVWELMEGLDDDDHEEEDEGETERDDDVAGVERKTRSAPGSPVFDPEILDAFREALDELSPASPPPPDVVVQCNSVHVTKSEIQRFPGIVRERVSAFQGKIDAKQGRRRPSSASSRRPPPESARRVVVYLTSLRGIRQTYEDCWSTSAVLRGYGVRVDERDLSLHAGYKDELRAALSGQQAGLPQVFADGRHLGGAEEVRRLHESAELAGALEACETVPAAKGGTVRPEACGGCGGVRFVPCDACSGSCKVFVVEDDDGAGAFRRCPECNENGLVRCPVC
jgi:glutaredoxin domain-containing cysteine-rich protein 1